MLSPIDPSQYARDALAAGCPPDQAANHIRNGVVLQHKQLLASAAARLCDFPGGPTAVGFGGARGGGKSYWLLVQMGLDDCQRRPGLKCLLLRKVGKSNREHFDDLVRKIFARITHKYSAGEGIIVFENGSRILTRHYHHESEIEALIGLEYDVVGIEEATTLTAQKHNRLKTICRTARDDWRPRTYSTTNPGGIGHEWYKTAFVIPYLKGIETDTRYIPALVDDNKFNNPEYKSALECQTGWEKEAWLRGNWNIQAGQFFKSFRPEVHVVDRFDHWRAQEWFAAMDYGYTHYTVVLLACRTQAGDTVIVDEYAARHGIPQQHIAGSEEMFLRNRIYPRIMVDPQDARVPIIYPPGYHQRRTLDRFVAGGDLFSRQFDGSTLAGHFREAGFHLVPANTNRVEGWSEMLHGFGDPDRGFRPTLYIHKNCQLLLRTLPYLQHDPDHPADILKTNVNDEGEGGDDAADAARYLIATKARTIVQRKLRGL